MCSRSFWVIEYLGDLLAWLLCLGWCIWFFGVTSADWIRPLSLSSSGIIYDLMEWVSIVTWASDCCTLLIVIRDSLYGPYQWLPDPALVAPLWLLVGTPNIVRINGYLSQRWLHPSCHRRRAVLRDGKDILAPVSSTPLQTLLNDLCEVNFKKKVKCQKRSIWQNVENKIFKYLYHHLL